MLDHAPPTHGHRVHHAHHLVRICSCASARAHLPTRTARRPDRQGNFAIGDTIYTGPRRISYAKIPSFSPEVFARCLCPSPSQSKAFNKGLDALIAEGAVQMLRERGEEAGGGVPVLAAVGPLQLEVALITP